MNQPTVPNLFHLLRQIRTSPDVQFISLNYWHVFEFFASIILEDKHHLAAYEDLVVFVRSCV